MATADQAQSAGKRREEKDTPLDEWMEASRLLLFIRVRGLHNPIGKLKEDVAIEHSSNNQFILFAFSSH